jgi:predicted O-linked N-acetylglucosamine transferase (SPINDLY family)
MIGKKIRLGYISPDLNKNAVGLFVTPLLKYYDSTRFDIFVYYTNQKSDSFTRTFKSYDGIHWRDCHDLSDTQLYDLVHGQDHIDILIDLITHGIGGRLEFLAMAPAPIIINYLGYPGVTDLPSVTHRITDIVCDPLPSTTHEQFLYMPRCFLCYHLFDGITLPSIKTPTEGKIHIGIMNKLSKHHAFIREVYESILSKNENIVLCIKLGEHEILPEEFYKNHRQQIKVMEFTESLEEYLEQYNQLDFCLDTYPYSGTTTTCSSLLMGVPVITYYNSSHRHVSNVTASILNACQLGEYICSTWEQYKKMANKPMKINREDIRNKFLSAMNPRQFMREFEDMLGITLSKTMRQDID